VQCVTFSYLLFNLFVHLRDTRTNVNIFIWNALGAAFKIELAIVSAVASRFGLFSMNDQSVDLSLSLYFT